MKVIDNGSYQFTVTSESLNGDVTYSTEKFYDMVSAIREAETIFTNSDNVAVTVNMAALYMLYTDKTFTYVVDCKETLLWRSTRFSNGSPLRMAGINFNRYD